MAIRAAFLVAATATALLCFCLASSSAQLRFDDVELIDGKKANDDDDDGKSSPRNENSAVVGRGVPGSPSAATSDVGRAGEEEEEDEEDDYPGDGSSVDPNGDGGNDGPGSRSSSSSSSATGAEFPASSGRSRGGGGDEREELEPSVGDDNDDDDDKGKQSERLRDAGLKSGRGGGGRHGDHVAAATGDVFQGAEAEPVVAFSYARGYPSRSGLISEGTERSGRGVVSSLNGC